MRIVICTINPIFSDRVIGGSTKHLRAIAEFLAARGHDIEIVCTRRAGESRESFLGNGVRLTRGFRFKQPFPGAYEIPAFQNAENIESLYRAAQDADRLFMFDGEFLYPPIAEGIPTIVSLRDCVYPETMIGSFIQEPDEIIVLNEYCKASLVATAGRFATDISSRVNVVHNGFDWSFFRQTPPSAKLSELLNCSLSDRVVVLHPHRSEISKGLEQTIDVVSLLVSQYKMTNICTLVTSWFDAGATGEERDHIKKLRCKISSLGLDRNFLFHPWIPSALMPEYYSLGDITLVLGSFVEAFGNVGFESMGCGTPVVFSRTSSIRTLLPDSFAPKVNFNDAKAAAEFAASILKLKTKISPESQSFLRAKFSIEDQLNEYERVIVGAKKRKKLQRNYKPSGAIEDPTLCLPPWCYIDECRIYNDFEPGNPQKLEERFISHITSRRFFTASEGVELGLSSETRAEMIERGYFTQHLH